MNFWNLLYLKMFLFYPYTLKIVWALVRIFFLNMEAFFHCLLASIMWLLHLPGAILFPRALYGTFLHLSWALFWNFRLWISAGIFFHSYARYTVGYFNSNDLQGMTFVKEWPSQITLPEGLFILNFSNHAFNFQRVLACVSIVLFF